MMRDETWSSFLLIILLISTTNASHICIKVVDHIHKICLCSTLQFSSDISQILLAHRTRECPIILALHTTRSEVKFSRKPVTVTSITTTTITTVTTTSVYLTDSYHRLGLTAANPCGWYKQCPHSTIRTSTGPRCDSVNGNRLL